MSLHFGAGQDIVSMTGKPIFRKHTNPCKGKIAAYPAPVLKYANLLCLTLMPIREGWLVSKVCFSLLLIG